MAKITRDRLAQALYEQYPLRGLSWAELSEPDVQRYRRKAQGLLPLFDEERAQAFHEASEVMAVRAGATALETYVYRMGVER